MEHLGSIAILATPEHRRRMLRTYFATVRLSERYVSALLGVRIGKVLGYVICLSYAAAIVYLGIELGGSNLDVAALNAVRWISAVSGTLGLLSVCHAASKSELYPGLLLAARLRGYSQAKMERALFVASASVLARMIVIPGAITMFAAAVLADSLRQAFARCMLILLLCLYAAALSVTLTAIGRWSAAVAPKYSRTLALMLLVLPHLARELWPATPSVPAIFNWVLAMLKRVEPALL